MSLSYIVLSWIVCGFESFSDALPVITQIGNIYNKRISFQVHFFKLSQSASGIDCFNLRINHLLFLN